MPYSDWKWSPEAQCPKCAVSGKIKWRVWISYDEAHEDVQHVCENCQHEWWIDGSDS